MHKFVVETVKQVRRVVIAIVGFTVILIGIIMIATPGPAIVVIPLGLAILATEFLWAKRLLQKVKDKIKREKKDTTNTPDIPPPPKQ